MKRKRQVAKSSSMHKQAVARFRGQACDGTKTECDLTINRWTHGMGALSSQFYELRASMRWRYVKCENCLRWKGK